MTSLRRNSSGFSLFELIVVMVIIGLGSALVIPRFFGSFSSMEVNAAARKIVSALKYARNVSIYSSTPYQVSVYTAQGLVRVEKILVEEQIPGMKTLRLENVQDIRTGDGVSILVDTYYKESPSNGVFRFIFYPSGSTRAGSIVLSNSEGDTQRVLIDSITGFAKLEG